MDKEKMQNDLKFYTTMYLATIKQKEKVTGDLIAQMEKQEVRLLKQIVTLQDLLNEMTSAVRKTVKKKSKKLKGRK